MNTYKVTKKNGNLPIFSDSTRFYDAHYYDSNGQNEQHIKLRADNIEHATERFNKLLPMKYLWKITAL